MKTSFSLLTLVFLISPLSGQVVLTELGSAYTENFNNISGVSTAGVKSWTDNSVIPGWYGTTVGATTQNYRATNANNTSPTTTAGSPTSLLAMRSGSEAAFGTVSSSSYYGVLGVQFVNNAGTTITSLVVSYVGEQWGWNKGGANTLEFTYSTDATSLSTGTWTSFEDLSFTALYSNYTGANSTGVGLNGNGNTIFNGSTYVTKSEGEAGGPGALNYTTISATITGLSIADGETFWLRWTDVISGSGVGQALGIDDFQLTAVPEPSSMLLMLGGLAVIVFQHSRYRIKKA